AIFVEVMTDNRNRTVADIRHALNKMGGNLGTDGSVAYLFSKQGIISYSPEMDEDQLMEAALVAGAEDLATLGDGSFEIVTVPDQFLDVKQSLVESGLIPDNAEVTMVPSTTVELDEEGAEPILKLIDMLEDLDDVQNVYHNADISADVMEALHQ
ncbi:YebC/PmpR family DNA-binding transcriptional regulator, partial [Marinobacter sp.]